LCGLAGVGQLAWQAALARDLPLLVNITILVTLVTLLANSGADVIGHMVRPRNHESLAEAGVRHFWRWCLRLVRKRTGWHLRDTPGSTAKPQMPVLANSLAWNG